MERRKSARLGKNNHTWYPNRLQYRRYADYLKPRDFSRRLFVNDHENTSVAILTTIMSHGIAFYLHAIMNDKSTGPRSPRDWRYVNDSGSEAGTLSCVLSQFLG
jgi:hypothetical protein